MTAQRRLAFATYADLPGFDPDDRLLIEPLARRGVAVEAVPWDDLEADWLGYDAVIVRSTWDYHRRPDDFRMWLSGLNFAGVPLHNPPDVLRWNMDKHYLRDLAVAGVTVVPTAMFDQHQGAYLAEVMSTNGWSEAVVKPRISASGEGAWTVTRAEAHANQARLDAMLAQRAVLIQPVLPLNGGEWSLIFCRGVYSHACLKYPAQDSIFVHLERGGAMTAATPPPDLVRQAAQVVRIAARRFQRENGPRGVEALLYARVDGLWLEDELILMELELIEPNLWLSYAPLAAERFADGILAALDGKGNGTA